MRMRSLVATLFTLVMIFDSSGAFAQNMRVEDVPLIEGATDVSYMKRRGDVRYEVNSDFKSVGNFYAQKLAADQWKKSQRDNLQRNFWVQTFSKGTMTLVVRVSDNDSGTDVRLTPTGLMWAEDDQPSPKDLPFPEDVSNLEYNDFLGWIDYSTSGDVKSVAEFLSQELETRKWTKDDTPFNLDHFVKMKFSKDKSTLEIDVRESDAGSDVDIRTKGMNWDGMKEEVARAKQAKEADDEKREMQEAALAKKEAEEKMKASLAERKEKPKQGIDKLPKLPNECTIVMDGTEFKLTQIIAYEIYEYEQWYTMILATPTPIKQASLIARLKASGTNQDADGNQYSWPEPYLELKLNDDNELSYMSFRAKGTPGSGSNDELAGTALVEDGRARGTAKLKEPGDFFDKIYTAEISFDVPVLTRDSTPEKRLGDAPRLANSATLTLGNRTYKLTNAVAYPMNFFDEPVTAVVLSEKPLNLTKLKSTLGREAADEYFEFTPQVKLTIDGDDNIKFINIWADNTSLNSNDSLEKDVVIEDGRVRGTAKMTEPGEFFDQKYTFSATFDLDILTQTGTGASMKPIAGLNADSYEGLPVPEGHDGMLGEGSEFRKQATTSVDAKLDAVVAFYRGHLSSSEWGQWKEDAQASQVAQDSANLNFSGPAGDLIVQLKSQGEQTEITLVTRDANAAKAAGMLPDPGKSRLVVINGVERESIFTINGQEYKLAALAGTEDPKTALNWSVPAATFTVVTKTPGLRGQTESVKANAGETWGVILTPTGEILSVQLY